MISTLQSVAFLVTIITLGPSPLSGALRAQFGEDCSKEVRCESRNFLTCPTSGKCDCIMTDTMIYDETVGKCVTLAGERCLYNKTDGQTSWTEELSCISGANCTRGVCECLSSHFEVSDGTCHKKRDHGQECKHNLMCDSYQHLICHENNCTCDHELGLQWDGHSCRVLAGNTCSNSDGQAQCISGATCDLSTCQCDFMYYQSSTKSCLPKQFLGGPCSQHDHCSYWDLEMHPSLLACVDNVCNCDPSFAVSENSDGIRSCRKKLGATCSKDECAYGALCSNNICQCDTTFSFQNENQICEPRHKFEESCVDDGQCISSLVCSSGTCKCASGKSFNVITNECVIPTGETCKSYQSSQNNKDCVPNAFCTGRSGDYYNSGSCQCDENFTASKRKDGYCYAKENVSCNGDTFGALTSKQCLPGLVCMDRMCTCEYSKHQVYDEASEKCYSFVGGPCSTSADCRDNGTAVCLGEVLGIRECQCKQGYVQVERGCQLVYGARCNLDTENGPSCDKVGGLKCNNKGVCDCPGLQVFSQDELSWKGLVGASCEVKGNETDQFCGTGSFCKPFRGFEKLFGMCTCLPGHKTGSDRRCTSENNGNGIVPRYATDVFSQRDS